MPDALTVLSGHLLAMKPTLRPEDISMGTLLVDDLGLDSLDLLELAERVRAELGQVDFTPWLVNATRGGGDSVGSLATFLQGQPPRSGEE